MDRPLPSLAPCSLAPSLTLRPPPRRRGLLARLLARLSLGRSRRHLAALDDHLLRDIGLTAQEARQEARRPIWDAPDHWLR